MSKVTAIIASPVIAKELQPGELFSTVGPDYWSRPNVMEKGIGERVYIRTNTPAERAPDMEETVYRITIDHGPRDLTPTLQRVADQTARLVKLAQRFVDEAWELSADDADDIRWMAELVKELLG